MTAMVDQVLPLQKGSRAKRRDEIAYLRAELQRLKERLGADRPSDIETWGFGASQEMKDQMAAQALISEKLDVLRALACLGFSVPERDRNSPIPEDIKAACYRIFGTEGVREILAQDFSDANAHKADIIGRLHQVARFGNNAECIRATEQLSRLCGWNVEKNPDKFPQNVVGLFQIVLGTTEAKPREFREVADPDAIIDAELFLDHVPGEAVRVIDEPEKRMLQ